MRGPRPDGKLELDFLHRVSSLIRSYRLRGCNGLRTASAQDIQDRIDDLPFGIGFRPAARFGSRNQWFENLPFSIIEIGWVGFSGLHTAILTQQTNPIPTFFDTLLEDFQHVDHLTTRVERVKTLLEEL